MCHFRSTADGKILEFLRLDEVAQKFGRLLRMRSTGVPRSFKKHSPLGPPYGPRHSPTVGSLGGHCSSMSAVPVHPSCISKSYPLSSKLRTYKTVKARFCPWLSCKSPENVSRCPLSARKRQPRTRESRPLGEVHFSRLSTRCPFKPS